MAENKNRNTVVKVLQIAAVVFMVAMVIVCLIIMKKTGISVKNPEPLLEWLSGNVFTVACILILINLVKSFALVITPSIIFVVSGLVFDNLWVAILVNFIATAISLVPTYYLGRFTGKSIIDTLKKKNKKISKIDDFAGQNGLMVSFIFKASGLIPCDTSSLIMGAMDIPFGKYYIGATLGTLPINIMWALLANKGDLKNPYTYLYVLPIIAFALLMSFVVKKITNKKNKTDTDGTEEKEPETAQETAE